MLDQAAQLRRLVSEAARREAERESGPCTVVVSGGSPGVGATTLAVNLAAALAGEALRVVLIDADLHRADVAARCGVAGSQGIGEVLTGRKNIHEALQRGPAGIQILAGNAQAETRACASDRANERLVRQMRSLGPHADWLLVDAGNQPSEITARLWSAADRVLLVASPDAVAVMDTYALIKTLLSRQPPARPLELIVNQVENGTDAEDVHRRIDQSCRRFLGLSLALTVAMPHDPAAAVASHQKHQAALAHPNGPLAAAISRLMREMLDSHQERNVAELARVRTG
jgi:flagellar biosynthesis protein FlhG